MLVHLFCFVLLQFYVFEYVSCILRSLFEFFVVVIMLII